MLEYNINGRTLTRVSWNPYAKMFCSVDSVSLSRSHLSDCGVSKNECNNRLSSMSLEAENNQCKNCIMLAFRVRSLSP